MRQEIFDGSLKNRGVVTDQPKQQITSVAKKLPHHPCVVAMVYVQTFDWRRFTVANETAIVLALAHSLKFIYGQTVALQRTPKTLHLKNSRAAILVTSCT